MKSIIFTTIFVLLVLSLLSQTKTVEITHYLFPKFTEGIVLMKAGNEHLSLLNYNSLTEEMIYEDNGQKLAMSLDAIAGTDTVFIGDRKFIVYLGRFVERVHASNFELFVEHKCKLSTPGKPSAYGGTTQTASVTTFSGLLSKGAMYSFKLPDGYTPEPYVNYIIKKNNTYQSFTNLKQMRKIYRHKKELYKSYKKTNEIDYNNPKNITALIEYLENNEQ